MKVYVCVAGGIFYEVYKTQAEATAWRDGYYLSGGTQVATIIVKEV